MYIGNNLNGSSRSLTSLPVEANLFPKYNSRSPKSLLLNKITCGPDLWFIGLVNFLPVNLLSRHTGGYFRHFTGTQPFRHDTHVFRFELRNVAGQALTPLTTNVNIIAFIVYRRRISTARQNINWYEVWNFWLEVKRGLSRRSRNPRLFFRVFLE